MIRLFLQHQNVEGKGLYVRCKNACLNGCFLVLNGNEQLVVSEAALQIRIVAGDFEVRALAVALEALGVDIERIIVLLITVDDEDGKTVVVLIPCAGAVDVVESLLAGVLRGVIDGVAGDVERFGINAHLHRGTLRVLQHRHECVVRSGTPYMVVVCGAQGAETAGHAADLDAVSVTEKSKLDGSHRKHCIGR